MTPQELVHSFEVAFDAAEGVHPDASILRRQFIRDFSTYFRVSERDLVEMGSQIALTNLDREMDSIADVRVRAIRSLERNLQRLKPGQSGVHEDVRRTEVAYCYKRILYSLTQVRHMAATGSKRSAFTESADRVTVWAPPNWYEEVHGILDVIIDEYIESDRMAVDRRLWDELEKALGFLHRWWRDDDKAKAHSTWNTTKWAKSSRTPREFAHELLDTSIRNSLTDIMAGYGQPAQHSWIFDNGKNIRDSISFTSREEFNLEGEWAKRWNLQPKQHDESLGGYGPDFSGNRGGNPASSKLTARAGSFPYDREVSYGRQPQYHDPPGPFDGHDADRRPVRVWEGLLEDLGAGEMGDGGLSPDELEVDTLKREFGRMFDETLPVARGMDSPSLFVLLADMDPDFVAQTFAPEDDSEMLDLYSAWGAHVADPGDER